MTRLRSVSVRGRPQTDSRVPPHALAAEDWDPSLYPAYIASKDNYAELHLALVDATRDRSFGRILDMGVGTGETSRHILAAHPAANLVGLDSSPRMLEAAAASLPEDRVSLVRARMEDPLPVGPFDLVVSALSIHHLGARAKRSLFARVGRVLVPGGRFVFGDLVKDPSVVSRLQRSIRDYGVAETARSIVHRYSGGLIGFAEPDRPDVLEDQLRWLAAAGLRPTVCWECDLLVVVSSEKTPDAAG